MTLAKLLVQLGLDSGPFDKGTKKAEVSLRSLGKKVLGFAAGLTAAFVGMQLGKKILNLGKGIDSLTDTIRVGTGATGAELKGLTDIALNVFKSIPTSMEAVGTALTQVQRITGATGKDLEDLTRVQLELARVTGTDLTTNIETTSKAFEQWGVSTADQVGKLDELFRASQQTGVPVATLAQQLTQYGPILRQMGFDLDSSVALLGTLGKAGLDAGQVITGMRTAFKNFADSGVTDTNAALKDVFDRIKNAPSDIAAGQLAIDTFGSRAGPALADSIRGGRLEFDTLLEVVKNGSDTILGAAADTNDLAENWQIFKNRLSVAVLPVATKLFNFLNRVGIPALEKLIGFIEKMSPNLRMAALGFGLLLGLIGPAVSVVSALGASIALLLGPIGLLIAAIVLIGVAYKKNFLGFADGVHRFAKWFKGLDFKHGALGDLVDIFQDLAKGNVRGAVKEFQNLIREVGDSIARFLDAHGLTQFATIVSSTFHHLAQMIGAVFALVDDLVHGRWNQIWGDLARIAGIAVALFWDYIRMIPSLVWDAFKAIDWGAIADFITSKDTWNAIFDAGNLLMGALGKGIAAGWDWLWGWFKGLPARLADPFANVWNAFFNIGYSIIAGMSAGISAVWNWLTGWISSIIDQLNRIPDWVRPGSPSKTTTKLGLAISQGIGLGISRGMRDVDRAVGGVNRSLGTLGGAGSTQLGAMPAVAAVGAGAGGGGNRSFVFHVNGAADPETTARVIMRHIRRVEAGAH